LYSKVDEHSTNERKDVLNFVLGMGERTFIVLQWGSLLSTGNLEIEGTGEESRQGIVFPVYTGRK
jgi:hypothetical protein